jgi:hypothetical protein
MTELTTGEAGETDGSFQDEDGRPEDGPGPVLFEGDCGQLDADVRRTLVTILKRRYISAELHPEAWRLMTENRLALESRLNDMFLQLAVHREYGIAYKRQATPDGAGTFPTVLHNLSYTREQTVLMVHLRGVFRAAIGAGDGAVFVDGKELLEEASNYLPATTTNHVEAERAAQRAVETLEKSDILLKTAEPGRYRVSPVIEVLLPVGVIRELAASLARQRGAPAAELTDGEDVPEDEEDSQP